MNESKINLKQPEIILHTQDIQKLTHFHTSTILTLSNPMSDLVRHYDFPVPDAFPRVVRTLANR
jgi:hypothetical protein